MKIGNRDFFFFFHTYIMGILNVTPDSFSDGGSHNSVDKALKRTEQMISEGASIIDVGGESTRPNYTMISEDEEIERTAPVIEQIKQHFDIPVSIDTYKHRVAAAAAASGADMINDIWGLQYDSGEMAKLIADSGCTCCLMHNHRTTEYRHFMADMITQMKQMVSAALSAGIPQDKIVIDPGIGFGKTYEMNLSVLKHLDEVCRIGYPVLLGCSRKSVIGNTLHLPVSERVEGTAVTTVQAVLSGCAFVRVHDIKENERTIRMARAILEAE